MEWKGFQKDFLRGDLRLEQFQQVVNMDVSRTSRLLAFVTTRPFWHLMLFCGRINLIWPLNLLHHWLTVNWSKLVHSKFSILRWHDTLQEFGRLGGPKWSQKLNFICRHTYSDKKTDTRILALQNWFTLEMVTVAAILYK